MINSNTNNRLKFLVLFCLGMVIQQLGYAQTLSVDLQVTSCNTITALGSGGTNSGFQYKLGVGGTYDANATFNVGPDTYDVYVKDDKVPIPNEAFSSVTIIDPSTFTVTLSKTTAYICTELSGLLNYTINGGTGPFDKSSPLTPLSSGNGQTIIVTDAHGCIATSSYDVFIDGSAPQLQPGGFPENYYQPIADYNLENSITPIDFFFPPVPPVVSTGTDFSYTTEIIDLSSYSDVKVSLDITQLNVATWNNIDYINIQVSYDGGPFVELPTPWIDKSRWNGLATLIM